MKEEKFNFSFLFNLIPKTSEQKKLETHIDFDSDNLEQIVNGNLSDFTTEELSLKNNVWQKFTDLDYLNRVGEANAMIGMNSFPDKEREDLYINPSGWKQKKIGENEWLFNRCHLIGHQLTGENNNAKNLMTGTRSFNTPYMQKYEDQIKAYILKNNEHVRYRVTPYFKSNELVARGVQLEAKSIESEGLEFNVFIFNRQEGYVIDYRTGKSKITTK